MADDNANLQTNEPEKSQTEVTTEEKLSTGTKIALTVIVLVTVGAGVYLALTLSK